MFSFAKAPRFCAVRMREVRLGLAGAQEGNPGGNEAPLSGRAAHMPFLALAMSPGPGRGGGCCALFLAREWGGSSSYLGLPSGACI